MCSRFHWILNKFGEWNITTEQFFETLMMFLHQCAKQAATNDDARWGKYLNFASRAIPKGAGYSGHDLVPAAIRDSVSATGLAQAQVNFFVGSQDAQPCEKGRCPSMRQGDAQPRENLVSVGGECDNRT